MSGNIANLTPWKPGQSGNPEGRRRKRPLTEAYDELLRMVMPDAMRKQLNLAKVDGVMRDMKILGPGATWAEGIAIGQIRKAMLGEVASAKELREATEGKSTQRIELLSQEDRTVTLVRVFDEDAPMRPDATREIEAGPVRDAINKLIATESEGNDE